MTIVITSDYAVPSGAHQDYSGADDDAFLLTGPPGQNDAPFTNKGVITITDQSYGNLARTPS